MKSLTWDEMSDEERSTTVVNMQRYGGSFAKAIGEAFQLADSDNLARLVAAFPDLIKRYQPAVWGTPCSNS